MPQLQIPLSIWLESTPDERDGFYQAAGFDPNLPVIDAGTDTSFVRFRQDEPMAVVQEQIAAQIPFPSTTAPQPGDDLRDFEPTAFFNPAVNGAGTSIPQPAATVSVAGRALRLILGGGGGRLTAAIWNSLPSPVRTALTQVGIGVGTWVAFRGDIPIITLPGQGNGDSAFESETGGPLQTRTVDIQIGEHVMHGAAVVGFWVANGVTFYRLQDGKIAVQNKKGRWKVWKPKKPIVLYADGASNLKTMLRADKALNKQAKKIASMLNRRAPRRKTSTPSSSTPVILGNNARVVDV
jgi:hypothetical protein